MKQKGNQMNHTTKPMSRLQVSNIFTKSIHNNSLIIQNNEHESLINPRNTLLMTIRPLKDLSSTCFSTPNGEKSNGSHISTRQTDEDGHKRRNMKNFTTAFNSCDGHTLIETKMAGIEVIGGNILVDKAIFNKISLPIEKVKHFKRGKSEEQEKAHLTTSVSCSFTRLKRKRNKKVADCQSKSRSISDKNTSDSIKASRQGYENSNGENMMRYNEIDPRNMLREEEELEMIKMIDNPKRKKKKKKVEDIDMTMKISHDREAEMRRYCQEYENEMIKILSTSNRHLFMKENFSSMYNLENFYLHIKKRQEKREKRENTISMKIGVLSKEKADTPTKCKKIWGKSNLPKEEVQKYINHVEKLWPIDKFIWSEEASLEYLMLNNYNVSECITSISAQSLVFLQFLLEKNLSIEHHLRELQSMDIQMRRIRYSKIKQKLKAIPGSFLN